MGGYKNSIGIYTLSFNSKHIRANSEVIGPGYIILDPLCLSRHLEAFNSSGLLPNSLAVKIPTTSTLTTTRTDATRNAHQIPVHKNNHDAKVLSHSHDDMFSRSPCHLLTEK